MVHGRKQSLDVTYDHDFPRRLDLLLLPFISIFGNSEFFGAAVSSGCLSVPNVYK